MNTESTEPAGDARPGAVTAPETRGRTRIADRVLEKIAACALLEIDQAGGAARRLLGVPLGPGRGGGAPGVTAHVDGGLATLRMRIQVVYPAPIRDVTGRLRAHVRARVGELTGLDVRQVDIDVARLVQPDRPGGQPP